MILDIIAALGLLAILAICVHGMRAPQKRAGFLLMAVVTLVAIGVLVADNVVAIGLVHGARFGAVILGVMGLINGALVLAQMVSGKPWNPRTPRRPKR
ncbi:hypothetical protein [Nitrospirillum viridazoti]|uniref:Uncharacterized protein n=1 Tax=Nitrospirillum viridazoti CBAmc TaxID=1441467 RepID=A0A248JYY4_9PROT|nr:hypothetical protein [Nitrospirillum amazonense]ASG23726.1 hypothetical protein Y958_22340 [Nitrospirillum amazonense CBAmc]TWB44877.1 hypothetical protein FBZ91_101348 [Nitrospirillum amazonense]